MPRNILIDPQRDGSSNPSIQFSGSMANTIKLEVLTSGSVQFTGVSGSLLSVVDTLSGSLFAVSDVSGLPILETFSDDRVVMGRYNSNALVVTGSRVGIGVSNPQHALHVVGTLFATSLSATLTGSNVSAGQVMVAGTGGVLSGSNNFWWDNSNNRIGIGTSDPSISSWFAGRVLSVYGPSESRVAVVESTNNNFISLYQQAGDSYLIADRANATPTQNLRIYTGGNEAMRISSSGNVGIGTNSYTARLHVSGSSTGTVTTLLARHGVANGSNLPVLDVQNSAGTSLLFVSGSGNVGIGTVTPAAPLEVFNSSVSVKYVVGSSGTGGPSEALSSTITSFANSHVFRSNTQVAATILQITPSGLIPGVNNAYDVGTTALRWRNIYATNISGSLTGSNISAGQVAVAGTGGVVSGSNNLWWDNAAQTLGIGTNSPLAKLDVRGNLGIGGGVTYGNGLTVSSTNTSSANHTHYFRGPATGTNDDVHFDLNRGGGAYGSFRVIFNSGLILGVAGGSLIYNGNILMQPVSNVQIATGKLSIGGATPVSQLEVTGSGATSATSTMHLVNGSNTSLMFVRNDGNVGIGSSSPVERLDVVSGSVRAKYYIGSYDGEILAGADAGGYYFASGAGKSTAIPIFMGNSGVTYISLRTNGTERLRIDSTGLLPGTNNALDIGSSGQRWRDVYARTGSFSGDVSITGNLNVLGTQTIVNSETVNVKDNIILLNANPTPLSTGGIHVADTTANITGSLIWDTATDTWKAGIAGSETTLVSGSGTNGLVARWTGTSSLSTGVLYDNGTNVGIGDVPSTAKLFVRMDNATAYTDTGFNTTALHLRNGTGGLSSVSMLQFSSNNSGAAWWIGQVESATVYQGILVFQARTGVSTTAERMRIDTSGNVGIGTTNPGRKLTISRDTESASGQLELRTVGSISDGNFDGIYFTQGATGGVALASMRLVNATSGNPHLAFYTRVPSQSSESEKMRIDNDGNVGIGTSSYTARLFISGSSTGTTPSLLVRHGVVNGSNLPVVNVQNSAGTSILFISGSGNVGIGNTLPSYNLDVVGQVKTRNLTSGDATGIIIGRLGSEQPRIQFTASDDSARFKIQVNGVNGAAERLGFYAGPLGGVATTEAVVLGGNGNLGVGGTYPLSRLEVTGSGATSATSALHLLNSANTSLMFVRNDGLVGIGTNAPSNTVHIKTTNPVVRLEASTDSAYLDYNATRLQISAGGGSLQFATGNTLRWLMDSASGFFYPNTDDTGSVGANANRVNAIYARRYINGPSNSGVNYKIAPAATSAGAGTTGWRKLATLLVDANDWQSGEIFQVTARRWYATGGYGNESATFVVNINAYGTTLATVFPATYTEGFGNNLQFGLQNFTTNGSGATLYYTVDVMLYVTEYLYYSIEYLYAANEYSSVQYPGSTLGVVFNTFYPTAQVAAAGDLVQYTTPSIFTNRMGLVGIGTAATTYRFLVQGSTSTSTPTMLIKESQAMANATAVLDVQNSSGTSILFVTGSGKVGIGTSTPSTSLYVYGGDIAAAMLNQNPAGYFAYSNGDTNVNFNSSGLIRLTNNNSTAGNNTPIDFYNSSGNVLARIAAINENHVTHVGSLVFATRNAGSYGEKMRIDSNGNVGIGTANANGNRLAIAGGNLSLTGSALPGATTTYDLGSTSYRWNTVHAAYLTGSLTKLQDGTSYIVAGSGISVTTGSNGAVTIATAGGGAVTGTGVNNYVARWNSASSLTTGVLYDDGTNVGINTTSMTLRLEVSGSDANIHDVRVGRGPGSTITNTLVGGNAGGALGGGAIYATIVGAYAGNAVSTGNYNTLVGTQAGANITTASNNTHVGANAGYRQSGVDNTSLGKEALFGGLTATATANTALGSQAGYSVTTGGSNFFGGYQASFSNSVGAGNVSVGYQALYTNASGSNNVAIGYQANYLATVRNASVAIGYQALYTASSTDNQVAIGYQALFSNTAWDNVGVGLYALASVTSGGGNTAVGAYSSRHQTGASNTAFGYQALTGVSSQSSAAYNTAIGQHAGYSITTGGSNFFGGYQAGFAQSVATNNVLIGYQAGVAITSGSNQTIIGYSAGTGLTTGDQNTIVGRTAGILLTTEQVNTFIGMNAGRFVKSSANTSVGYDALLGQVAATSTGGNNVGVGYQAGRAINTGSGNVYLGTQAGLLVTDSSNNVLLGYQAGDSVTTGGNNVVVGAGADLAAATNSNSIVIGSGSVGLGNNTTVLGNSSTTTTYIPGSVGAGVTSPWARVTAISTTETSTAFGLTYDVSGNYRSGLSSTFSSLTLTDNKVYLRVCDTTLTGQNTIATFVGDGSVGIGTTNTSARLHVTGSSTSTAQTALIRAGVPNQIGPVLEVENHVGSTLLVVSGSGRVGIGTSNPQAVFHVAGGSAPNLTQIYVGFVNDNYYDANNHYFRDGGANNRARIDSSGNLTPAVDNTQNLGSTALRWANVFANNVVASGSLGPAYTTATSTSGDTAIYDTVSVTLDAAVYELMIMGNPNLGGSGNYMDVIYGKIIIGTGWNGSAATNYIQFVRESPDPRALYPSGGGPLTADVVYFQSSAERTNVASGSTAIVRVKVSGYVNNTGYNTTVRLKRLM